MSAGPVSFVTSTASCAITAPSTTSDVFPARFRQAPLLPVPPLPPLDSLPLHQGTQASHRAAATNSFPRPRNALMPTALLHLSLRYAARSMVAGRFSAAPS